LRGLATGLCHRCDDELDGTRLLIEATQYGPDRFDFANRCDMHPDAAGGAVAQQGTIAAQAFAPDSGVATAACQQSNR
jgi:hypothetical protein